MKKIVRILALALVLLTLAGCGGGTTTVNCRDLSMTVSNNLANVSSRSEFAAYTFTLDSNNMAIFGLQERYDEYPVLAEYDLKGYTDLLIQANSLTCVPTPRTGNENYYYFTYDYQLEDGAYRYMTATFQSNDGFWMLQICAPILKFKEAECFEYLDSVDIH